MRWWVKWDGTRLVVAQRPGIFLIWGIFACSIVSVVVVRQWVPETLRDIGAGDWRGAGRGAMFAVMLVGASAMVGYAVTSGWKTVSLDCDQGVRSAGLRRGTSLAPSRLQHVLLNRQMRTVVSRWGRGPMPFIVLTACFDGGRAQELLALDEAALGDAEWRALREGLGALPFGRVKLKGVAAEVPRDVAG